MTTVTAKKLRDNLSEYLDRLEKGEEIIIIRHSEVVGSLKPVNLSGNSNGQAIAAMLERNTNFFKANTRLTSNDVSSKDLYKHALDEKYGL
ncbi:MAG TPA: type II toxin-antitoxin system Phd/YefM family antitoxin [Candidatus Saccharimonadales bacterium]|nr:type II toxin-antitoxin system Phd/YefM family antitoxin [Candidatus Saccharimonadales bacterium]